MDSLSYKTQSAKPSTVKQEWHIVDAEDKVLGRLASEIAKIIRGKHKPSFTPHVNCGDKVIVINADKIRLTGNKMENKVYRWYTGYPSGQRERTPREYLDKKPTEVLKMAVNNMLPKNRLQQRFMQNLFLYAGTEHPHHAQQPQKLEL